MTDELPPTKDPSWSRYPETILELRLQKGTITIDLRRPLTQPERQTLATSGTSVAFAVITAFNPVGRQSSEQENESRHESLRETLIRDSIPFVQADGVSPDGAHREAGISIWVNQDAASSIAERFKQSAFFWFDGRAFWIVGALVAAAPILLPRVSVTYESHSDSDAKARAAPGQ